MANPMHRQIAEDLRAKIESGELEPVPTLYGEVDAPASGETLVS